MSAGVSKVPVVFARDRVSQSDPFPHTRSVIMAVWFHAPAVMSLAEPTVVSGREGGAEATGM